MKLRKFCVWKFTYTHSKIHPIFKWKYIMFFVFFFLYFITNTQADTVSLLFFFFLLYFLFFMYSHGFWYSSRVFLHLICHKRLIFIIKGCHTNLWCYDVCMYVWQKGVYVCAPFFVSFIYVYLYYIRRYVCDFYTKGKNNFSWTNFLHVSSSSQCIFLYIKFCIVVVCLLIIIFFSLTRFRCNFFFHWFSCLLLHSSTLTTKCTE